MNLVVNFESSLTPH